MSLFQIKPGMFPRRLEFTTDFIKFSSASSSKTGLSHREMFVLLLRLPPFMYLSWSLFVYIYNRAEEACVQKWSKNKLVP